MSLYQSPFFFYSLSLLISFSVIVVSPGRVLTVTLYIIAGLCGRENGECEPLLHDLCDAKWSELWVNGNKQRIPKQCEHEYRFSVLEWRVLWAIQGHNWTLFVSSSSFWPFYQTIHFCAKSLNNGQQNMSSARLWWLRLDRMKDGGWGFQMCSYNIAFFFFYELWPFFCWDCDFLPSLSRHVIQSSCCFVYSNAGQQTRKKLRATNQYDAVCIFQCFV